MLWLFRTLILYESKYGSTEEVAKKLALILGPAKYCRVNEFKEEYKEFDLFIIGSPVYEESVDEKIIKFALNNTDWLQNKKVVLFCTCLSKVRSTVYLSGLKKILKRSVLLETAFGGKFDIEKLDSSDHDSIVSFMKTLHIPVKSMDITNNAEVIDYALKIKSLKDSFINSVPEAELKTEVESFLYSHNSCVLCTGFNENVRSTPIEYMYKDGYIYFLTEGGEKFANILQNKNVSISIFESYKSMADLAGMQIQGKAEIVIQDDEYNQILSYKGINYETLKKYPINMNILKVRALKAEFLYSKFKSMGYEARQILNFK